MCSRITVRPFPFLSRRVEVDPFLLLRRRCDEQMESQTSTSTPVTSSDLTFTLRTTSSASTTKPSASFPRQTQLSSGSFVSFPFFPLTLTLVSSSSVHPILRRLETLADLPLLPALLATVHEKAPADLMKYKMAPVCSSLPSFLFIPSFEVLTRSPHVDQEKMLPYLKELTQSQIDRGLIKFVFTVFPSLTPLSPSLTHSPS
jgi:hypothetical protein